MIVFAILGLLIGLLFMFVRQKLSALESRVNLLTDTVQTMAGFRRVEDEEESEDEDESEEEDEEEEEEKGYFTRVGIETGTAFGEVGRMEKEDMKVVSDDEVEVVELNEVTEVKEDVKKIQLEGPDYESLSLKELKDKVSDLGGPKLRTKKELVEFLKNVM
uniref:Uncharacterized protein n=1 Tax=viral metagenome TaxID=1070528 RepID=A0A6C0HXF1_9ZZZZ